MTNQQKLLADEIVKYFKETNGVKTHIDAFLEIVKNTSSTKSELSYMLSILEEKYVIKCSDGMNRQVFYLTPDGWNYVSYENLLQNELLAKQKKDRKDFIDFSIAERIYKTYSSTRIIAIISCVVAVFLALLKLAEALKLWPYNK